MNIKVEFYIKVARDGKQTPFMNTGEGDRGYLSNLAIGRMGQSKVVEKELMEINNVIEGKKEKYFLCHSDTICLDIYKHNTLVYNGLGDIYFKPFKMKTEEIGSLLQEWYVFLKEYERNEIPGIKNTFTLYD